MTHMIYRSVTRTHTNTQANIRACTSDVACFQDAIAWIAQSVLEAMSEAIREPTDKELDDKYAPQLPWESFSDYERRTNTPLPGEEIPRWPISAFGNNMTEEEEERLRMHFLSEDAIMREQLAAGRAEAIAN